MNQRKKILPKPDKHLGLAVLALALFSDVEGATSYRIVRLGGSSDTVTAPARSPPSRRAAMSIRPPTSSAA